MTEPGNTDVRELTSRNLAKRTHESQERRASNDFLTGLRNRGFWEKEAEDFLKIAKRSKENVGLIMMDADHFKELNDRFGHAIGDEALKAIARALKRRFRESDILGRYGGDEFVILLPSFDKPDSLEETSNLSENLKSLYIEEMGNKVPASFLGLSLGLVRWNGIESLAELEKRADEKMYQRKRKNV